MDQPRYTDGSSKSVFTDAQLNLLSQWLLLYFSKKNMSDFLKQISTIKEMMNRESAPVLELHLRLEQYYVRSRASFWFELIDAVDQGLISYCEKKLIILGMIHYSDDLRSMKESLIRNLIRNSPFPRDIWIRTSTSRQIILPGGRLIMCE